MKLWKGETTLNEQTAREKADEWKNMLLAHYPEAYFEIYIADNQSEIRLPFARYARNSKEENKKTLAEAATILRGVSVPKIRDSYNLTKADSDARSPLIFQAFLQPSEQCHPTSYGFCYYGRKTMILSLMSPNQLLLMLFWLIAPICTKKKP